MSPKQVIALGPELLPWARAYTNDLSEAHFLVHQVVVRLVQRAAEDDGPVGVARAQVLMSELALKSGIVGRRAS
jgi:hypothetical protein